MLKKLNFTLLSIVVLLFLVCIGLTIYYNKVDVTDTNYMKVLEETVMPGGDF